MSNSVCLSVSHLKDLHMKNSAKRTKHPEIVIKKVLKMRHNLEHTVIDDDDDDDTESFLTSSDSDFCC